MRRESLDWELVPPMESDVPASHWRSLHYYNLYRLIVAGVFVESFILFGPSLYFGVANPGLFFLVSVVYAVLAVLSIATISLRWPRFTYQLNFQILTDIAVTVTLMYTSGGVKSGIGLVLVASLAAAALVSGGRMAIFYAALATVAILGEQIVLALELDWTYGDFVHTAMLGIGYMATAGLAHALAQRVSASERLAEQRRLDLKNMAEVSQLVMQDMDDGVLVVDPEGHVRQTNNQAERLLGTDFGEGPDLHLSHYSSELDERLRRWRTKGELAEPLRVAATGKQVRVRFLRIGESGEIGEVIFLEDLSQVQAQAQQLKLAALGRLTANIAHEIRNPLSAISHATQILQEDGNTDKTTVRLLEIIRNNTVRLDRLVQDVLQLNRRDRAQVETIDITEFMTGFAEEFAQAEQIPPGVIDVELDTDRPICFDRSHLHQVLWNLCRNAWRHCQKKDHSIRLYVSRALMNNVVQIDVIDDGPGVDAEMLDKLFEPFFTTESLGTGLGLYIAREVCQANDASLDYIEVAPGGQFRICCKGGPC